MAYYAFLNKIDEGVFEVVEVIPGRNEDEIVDGITDWEKYYGDLKGMKCLRTSYNGNIRKNFASLGGVYLEEFDAFIPPSPGYGWKLDYNTFKWYIDV